MLMNEKYFVKSWFSTTIVKSLFRQQMINVLIDIANLLREKLDENLLIQPQECEHLSSFLKGKDVFKEKRRGIRHDYAKLFM